MNVLRLFPPTVCVICPATPKSARRTCPSALSSTFAAMTSRWILPSPCRYASAMSRSRSTTAHASSGSGRSRTRSATEPPAMYSMAIARRVEPSHSHDPRYFVTKGLSICASVAISRWMSSTSSSASSKSTSFTATVSPVRRSTARCTSPDCPRPMREPSSKRSPVSAMTTAGPNAEAARVACLCLWTASAGCALKGRAGGGEGREHSSDGKEKRMFAFPVAPAATASSTTHALSISLTPPRTPSTSRTSLAWSPPRAGPSAPSSSGRRWGSHATCRGRPGAGCPGSAGTASKAC